MPENAMHAKSYADAQEIGRKLKERANDKNLSNVEDYILARITRAGVGTSPLNVVLLDEPDDHETKFVVVPHKDIIDGTEPPSGPAEYTYRDEELPVAAHAVLEKLEAGGGLSDEDLGLALRGLAAARPDAKDFYFFKMGEYTVTQCQ